MDNYDSIDTSFEDECDKFLTKYQTRRDENSLYKQSRDTSKQNLEHQLCKINRTKVQKSNEERVREMMEKYPFTKPLIENLKIKLTFNQQNNTNVSRIRVQTTSSNQIKRPHFIIHLNSHHQIEVLDSDSKMRRALLQLTDLTDSLAPIKKCLILCAEPVCVVDVPNCENFVELQTISLRVINKVKSNSLGTFCHHFPILSDLVGVLVVKIKTPSIETTTHLWSDTKLDSLVTRFFPHLRNHDAEGKMGTKIDYTNGSRFFDTQKEEWYQLHTYPWKLKLTEEWSSSKMFEFISRENKDNKKRPNYIIF